MYILESEAAGASKTDDNTSMFLTLKTGDVKLDKSTATCDINLFITLTHNFYFLIYLFGITNEVGRRKLQLLYSSRKRLNKDSGIVSIR